MPLTIWNEASRRCTVTVSGAGITVRLIDGDHLVEQRAVSSADQALSLAEVWKGTHPSLPRPAALRTRRARHAVPRPTSNQPDGTAAIPRVMWIDRR
jgi:hypothetical protein